MTDAERERVLDARIQARLSTDRAYRNAENTEEQAEREAEIEREENERLERDAEYARAAQAQYEATGFHRKR